MIFKATASSHCFYTMSQVQIITSFAHVIQTGQLTLPVKFLEDSKVMLNNIQVSKQQ